MAGVDVARGILLGMVVTLSTGLAALAGNPSDPPVAADAQPSDAQISTAPASGTVPKPSGTDREREYADLLRDAAAIQRQSRLLKRVVQFVRPSVVHIDAQRYERQGASASIQLPVEETGSGVVVDFGRPGGQCYILTNLHVIRNTSVENIRVRLADGRVVHPLTTWSDPGTDLAVLKVDEPGLVPCKVGDTDNVDIGDYVLAFGSPFGLSHSVTFGIISAKGRRDIDLTSVRRPRFHVQEFLQTDAAINPGNSGGPLVNLGGEVIGINTAIASNSGGSEGIGFSIPIEMAMVVAKQLIDRGNVVYAYLGVHLDSTFTPAVAAEIRFPHRGGARVKHITPNSPAALAGLRSGDVILRFGDTDVEGDTHLVNLVSLTPVGTKLPVLVYRDSEAITVEVTVSERSLFER